MRAERLFRSPKLFLRNRPKQMVPGQITLHAPPAFSASFRPSTAPLPALFAAKRGFFAPNARRTRPRRAPERPVLPRHRPVFARHAPEKPQLGPEKALASRPEPRRAHSPGCPEAPACAAFLPARTRFCPPCAARTPEGCPSRRRNHPAVRRQPARCRRPPPEGQPPPRQGTALGLATPTAEVGFPASP